MDSWVSQHTIELKYSIDVFMQESNYIGLTLIEIKLISVLTPNRLGLATGATAAFITLATTLAKAF